MRILLAIDDSKFSEAAVEAVRTSIRPEGTEVRVVHIVEPLVSIFQAMGAAPQAMGAGAEYYPPVAFDWDRFQQEQIAKGRKLVDTAAGKLCAAGFRTDVLVREGVARTDIVDLAAEWSADLIMLGAHGRRGLDRLLLGSVSDFVSRHAKCSVEIVRIPAGKNGSAARN